MARRKKQQLLNFYQHAAASIVDAGYAWEVDWQRSRIAQPFTEHDLLREAAWVILCSGFREAAVRKSFDYVSLCFCDWESAFEITENRRQCIETAFPSFRNEAKLSAIATVAEQVCTYGFDEMRARIACDPISALQIFPFVGPITSWHLAKNLGLDVAKNDRHLARIAVDHGYADAHDVCEILSDATGEPRSVIDIVLWRYASLVGITSNTRRGTRSRLDSKASALVTEKLTGETAPA